MILIAILVGMFILGSVFGSFACCQAWRWRYKIEKKKSLGKRSVCLNCGYQLKWYDNIPIISWLVLRGKCRKCKKKIGLAEILSELGTGMAFMMIGHTYLVPILFYWKMLMAHPLELGIMIAGLILTLAMIVVLVILSVYDAKWGELPVVLLRVAIGIGAAILGLKIWDAVLSDKDIWTLLLSVAFGIIILAGTCYAIYKLSHGKLMGGGDWILALGIALAIGDWWLSLWAMFLANLLGDIIMLPSLVQKGNHVVHFGPFLTIGFVVAIWLAKALPTLMSL